MDETEALLPDDEASHLSRDKKEKGSTKYLCGIAVKKDTTYLNLIALPMLPFITCTVNFYALAFMPLLLQSEDYFSVNPDQLGKATSEVIIWTQLFTLIMTPFMMYVYETVGRRIPVAYALLSTNLLVFLLPKVSPNFSLLCILRALIGLSNTLILGAPLISDNVKQ